MSDKNKTPKNQGKFKKEKIYRRINGFFFKIALTGDNKLLFRCYDTNNLDFNCYQSIKSAEEIFDLYQDMEMYETSSVLYNVITGMFDLNCSIEYDKKDDGIIIVETNHFFSKKKKINFKLPKEGVTCIKEYINFLCETIRQLKEDSSEFKKTKKSFDSEYNNIKKLPNLLEDVEKLKQEIKSIKDILHDKQKQIDSLKNENKNLSKLTEKNTTEINILKEENKNLNAALADNHDQIEEILTKIEDNKMNKPKMTVNYFNKKYRTHIGYYQIKYLNLNGSFIGNIGLRDLCKLDFIHLETLNLSNNYIKDISPLETAKFSKLKELILFFNNINDINSLKNVNFNLLTRLGLSDNYISDIKVLENVEFFRLEKLALSNNKINDINILERVQFNLLRELKISGNNISDISVLANVNFPKLKCLLLSNNKIKNIDSLGKADFPILFELKLSNNSIKDISIFEHVKFHHSLKYLHLSHNFISNINNIKIFNKLCHSYNSSCCCKYKSRLFDLKELNLAGNLIDVKKYEDDIDNLKSYIKHLII